MSKIPNRKPNRLSNYDYSNEGVYFVTICSKNRGNIFSRINNYAVPEPKTYCRDRASPCPPVVRNNIKIELTDIGRIIERQWFDISKQYDNVDTYEFVIMPNHIHGIVVINKRTAARAAPTTLSKMIGSFKSKRSVTYLKHI